VRYLVLQQRPDGFKLLQEFDNLQPAISYLLSKNLVASAVVVKVIENWEIKEK